MLLLNNTFNQVTKVISSRKRLFGLSGILATLLKLLDV